MKVIGLTGGIASGKSTVARFLEELGVVGPSMGGGREREVLLGPEADQDDVW